MDTEDYAYKIDAAHKEILAWRNYFLDKQFKNEFKQVSEDSRIQLCAYFHSIPSDSFTDPLKVWHQCICCLILGLEENKLN
jgi:hypothetical protein